MVRLLCKAGLKEMLRGFLHYVYHKAPPHFNYNLSAKRAAEKSTAPTAACNKAGQPNDVCPYGQVMLPSAMMFVSQMMLRLTAQWANSTSFLREQKHHKFTAEEKAAA